VADATEGLDSEALARQLLAGITSSWVSQAIHVAAELGIADLLHEPRASAELAERTGTHAPSLHRLLRALTTIDICRERADGSFELTELGAMLKSDHPRSLRSWSRWWGGNLWPAWGNLLYSVRTGRSARAMLSGTEGFQHLERDPESAAVFNQALVELTRLSCASIVQAYDFSALRRIVDVGGGYGELLAAILQAHPATAGVLFDLPHALDGARRHFENAGLADRCEFQAGDFFQSIPAGADAYILKSVIHDWNDERAQQILASCRQAMHGSARLLLIEQVMPDALTSSTGHQSLVRSDLNMLVAHGAGERSETAFRALLDGAGLTLSRIVPVPPTFHVLEAWARS
jgi:hypothetical protein